jgi:DNA-binding Lrp family transcriptional regulator|tara:strand:+ start:972 stop:1319 length:348 start_codon:yes stop_codon:yes gene_type:complete
MLDDGAIRRIGIVPNHYALGYTHNLMVVWDVDERHLAGIGDELGQLPFVSHCYQRPRRPGWTYNLFVMIHGKSDDEVDEKIQLLRQRIGAAYRCHTTLKSTRILKKTGLRLRQED